MTNMVMYGRVNTKSTNSEERERRRVMKGMKDRFTDAFSELETKNPFTCETCDERYGHPHKEGKTMPNEKDMKDEPTRH
ncbi:MAG: hypothetical protein SCI25_08500 [Desulfuromonadales bacterium]|nr:hypothetical protein [Desulfuromonadales bacterium]